MPEYKWNFDIRNTVPDYRDPAKDTPDVELFYDQINAMCFLLDGIPYRDVYENHVRHLTARLVRKLERLDYVNRNRLLKNNALYDALVAQFTSVRDRTYTSDVELRIFYERAPSNADESFVLNAFQTANAADVDNLVCMPFLDIQDDIGNEAIDEKDMSEHIELIGDYSLMDIYTRSKRSYSRLARAVVHGNDKRILRRVSGGTAVFQGTGQNNRMCNAAGDGCQHNPGTWCNLDSNGECTSGNL